MEKHFLTMEEVNEILREWSGKKVKIVKHELDDIDETLINLSKISYAKNDQRIDDYQSEYSLNLNGTGLIETTANNYEDLPNNSFEVPLEEDGLYEFDGDRIILSTTRGVYTLEIL
jgi:hypothetical protein